jgi:hypothetical protein
MNTTTKSLETMIYSNLLYFAIGDPNNLLIQSSRKAYRDMCRTLRLKNRQTLKQEREKVDNYLYRSINSLLEQKGVNQEEFDEWHKKACEQIIEFTNREDLELSVGQAQKWLNMVFKYYYISQIDDRISKILPFLHVPLDNYIKNELKKIDINSFNCLWSKINDYDVYLDIQKDIRIKLSKEVLPIKWEMAVWLEQALSATK